MPCNCGSSARTVFRIYKADGTYAEYQTLEAARAANDTEFGGSATIRTARVTVQKA